MGVNEDVEMLENFPDVRIFKYSGHIWSILPQLAIY
jgi:hypothetical protein